MFVFLLRSVRVKHQKDGVGERRHVPERARNCADTGKCPFPFPFVVCFFHQIDLVEDLAVWAKASFSRQCNFGISVERVYPFLTNSQWPLINLVVTYVVFAASFIEPFVN